jgi:predicted O-linked N-acetylglucosamine transferase (SPINDLY family)
MRHILAYRATLAAGYDHLMADAQDKRSMRARAQALLDEGRLADAAAGFRTLLAQDVEDWTALVGLASIALQSGDLQDAVQRFSGLVERDPVFAEGFYKRGNAYNRLGKLTAALADYDRAVALDPAHARAFCNRGTVLERFERWPEALASYDQALALNPRDAFSHFNRAAVLRVLDRREQALAAYDQAIAMDSNYVAAYVNRGRLLQSLSRPAEAAASYGRALVLDPLPSSPPTGVPVAPLRPAQVFLLGLKRNMQIQICDWTGIEADREHLAAGLRAGLPLIQPFPALALLDDPELQRAAAAAWIREECHPEPIPQPIPIRARGSKLRIGYFSPDFRIHPLAELTAGLFESHDRTRFEVMAFAFGPDTRDAMRTRLRGAFDRWVDVHDKTDRQAALLARDLGVDIAVDLAGFTEHSRLAIFALRAAPLQVSFLGYPGTTGADFMDYLVADHTVVPDAQRPHYAERLIYLPSFQANDSKRRIAERVFRRDELGLPASGFVYCCFNSTYKILPDMFACWMRILVRVPGSVLLLYADREETRRNLCQQAQMRGVNPDRIFFAGRLPPEEYRAQYRSMDLFLDTLPFNAGTTASDALWAGLPLLTCAGSAFAARMAASLLQTLGLPELVASTLGEYEEIAVRLAQQPAQLADLRQRLAQNRISTPLFDTQAFTRDLESGFMRAWQRHLDGLPPADIRIDRSP